MFVACFDWGGRDLSSDVTAAVADLGNDRFPEGTSVWTIGSAAVGIGRLFTADGRLNPAVASIGGHCAVVVDGRIDNLVDVRRWTGAPAEASSAEAVADAYVMLGESTLSRLVGEFSIAVVDFRNSRVLGWTDALGTRPLFYSRHARQFHLTNAIEVLRAIPGTRVSPDPDTVVEYLAGSFHSSDKTFFREIGRVPAGHCVVARERSLRVSRYWFPPNQLGKYKDRQECLSTFEALFRQSVSRRLVAQDPILVHVSGGVDSSSIFCVAQTLPEKNKVRGVGAVHPGLTCDESVFISEVANFTGSPIEVWNGCESDFEDLTRPGIAAPGSRVVMSGGSAGDIRIAERDGARVILSGVGGDQLGTPTGVLQDMFSAHSWQRGVRWTLGFPHASMKERLARLAFGLRGLLPPSWPRVKSGQRESPDWLTRSAKQRSGRWRPSSEGMAFTSHVQRRHWEELTSAQVSVAIEYIQRHATEHGVEVWFPFLDRDLVSFTLAVPWWFWPAPDGRERLHRDALRRVLPRGIFLRRDKAEFSVAYAGRVSAAGSLIKAMVNGAIWASEDYVDRDAARRLVSEVMGGSPNPLKALELWRVVTLEAWLRANFGYATERDGLHLRAGCDG